jgi:hypothetical protein
MSRFKHLKCTCARVLHVARGEYSSATTTAILLVVLTFVAYMRWKVKPISPRATPQWSVGLPVGKRKDAVPRGLRPWARRSHSYEFRRGRVRRAVLLRDWVW